MMKMQIQIITVVNDTAGGIYQRLTEMIWFLTPAQTLGVWLEFAIHIHPLG